ncbi:MAG: haloacid dehalogenase-like hydrolase [Bacilli bacterium]|nr:haloacid dehalogenase-like hydrolase [Bacilli bacterium]
MNRKILIVLAMIPLTLLPACQKGSASSTSQGTSSLVQSSLSSQSSSSSQETTTFKYWNECNALTILKAYVQDVTNKESKNFIPIDDRIATFDMDGTFYGELYPTYLEYWLLKYRALDDPTYKDKAPSDVVAAANAIVDHIKNGTAYPRTEDGKYGFDMVHARAQAKAFEGMTIKEFDDYVTEFLKTPVEGFNNMTFGEGFYLPMIEIFDYLQDNDFTTYVVTGSDRFITRALINNYTPLNVPFNQIIGMDVILSGENQGNEENLNYTYGLNEKLIRTSQVMIKDLKTNKVMNIMQEIGKNPVLSFGNSGGDSAMHNLALNNPTYKSNAFMLVADDRDRDYGLTDEKSDEMKADWTSKNYTVISMKNDFKTIYKEDAVKTSISI